VVQKSPLLACELLDACSAKSSKAPKVQHDRGVSNSNVNANSQRSPTDFSFAVISDTHIGAGEKDNVWLTEVAIKKINSMIESENIKMAFITGDLTDSAMPYQWHSVRKILDTFKVPYFPIIGNHDMWSYNATFEEKHPTGDAQFAATFADRFRNPPNLEGATISYNNKTCWNPEQKITSWFQNWELKYRNFTFLALDWNSRVHAVSSLGYKGAMPTAQLHDFPGGTFPWMVGRLGQLEENTQLVLLQHHPFEMPLFIPEFIYSFPYEEKEKVLRQLDKSDVKHKYWGVIAGHLHIWYNGVKEYQQWLTEASKSASSISIVRVSGGKITTISRYFGYDY